MNTPKPLFQKVDCVRLYVADLDTGLAFYRDQLGHEIVWRTPTAAGLRLPGSDTELVLHTERQPPEIDLLVDAAPAAADRFVAAGGKILVPAFEIQIGQAVVVQDPWGNTFVLLDASKGLLLTDADGSIIGNAPPEPPDAAR